jgi:hypothetical protein
MAGKMRFLLHCSIFALLPVIANAAGTYYDYNGSMQKNYSYSYKRNPFYNYGNGNQLVNQNQPSGQAQMNNQAQMMNYQPEQQNQTANYGNNNATRGQVYKNNSANNVASQDSGFKVGAGISHQFAMWKFDMKSAGSKLHYDSLNWNVFDASAQYDFDVANIAMRVDGGVQYGLQYGDSTMVDDDITGGGYFLQDWNVDLSGDGVADQVWSQQGHALSVGTSTGGDMLGVYAGLGLSNFWQWGNLKITPSIGYRYFKYKLETKRNYGMSLDTISGADNYCVSAGEETQCLPFLVFVDENNNPLLGTIDGVDINNDGYYDTFSYIAVPGGAKYAETENTYYYYQDGVSHSYEVEWSGPYIALDMLYDITANNSVNARVELGLPAYNATADQPYRPDWQHPKSLEDKGGIGDAYHFGLGANWLHSITNSVKLVVGMTFDYYNIGKADATSYMNPEYYLTNFYDPAVATNKVLVETYGNTNYESWTGADADNDKALYLSNLDTISSIEAMQNAGWKQEVTGEIESLYKSLGIRVGIQAKF